MDLADKKLRDANSVFDATANRIADINGSEFGQLVEEVKSKKEVKKVAEKAPKKVIKNATKEVE